MRHRVLRILLLLCALAASGTAAYRHQQESMRAEVVLAHASLVRALDQGMASHFTSGAAASTAAVIEPTGDLIAWAQWRAWVFSRIREVSFAEREPLSFGPWEAFDDYYTEEADAQGRLTQWSDNYYIVHVWAPIGQQIMEMQPGDSVQVNEHDFVVEGAFDYPRDGYLDEIEEIVGADAVVMQTCVSEQPYFRIVYGRDA